MSYSGIAPSSAAPPATSNHAEPSSNSQPSPSYGRAARFAAGSSSASGSGASTPSIPISRDQSRTPLGHKSGSPSSISPQLESFLALHTTLSGTSTIRESRTSLEEELQTDADPNASYDGGAPLSAARTAPQPSTSILNGIPTADGVPPIRPGISRTATDDAPSTVMPTPPPARSRPRRGRASTTTAYPPARYVPISKPPPLAPPSRPSSISPSPGPPTTSLQSHLYQGLLNSTLADLHLVVFNHFYRLHRIVLGQGAFFHSLLSGGFAEERTTMRRGSEAEVIQVELSAPMTRAAFELCLARLYGGGPELVAPPWAKTSPTYPLSEPFERLLLKAMGDQRERGREGQAELWEEMGRVDKQAATPTFLLSLLATSTYLEIPSIAATALEMIQTTITPWTVTSYLNFATGKGLGSQPVADRSCRGLEGVGAPYDLSRSQAHSHWTPTLDRSHSVSSNASYASSIVSGAETPDMSTAGHDEDTSIFVGPEGERVGEACACWLSKWGSDILRAEEWIAEGKGTAESFFYDEERPPSAVQGEAELRPPPLRVWSSLEGGLTSRWVRGIISSDAFFISASGGTPESDATKVGHSGLGSDGEFERYLFARRVVHLRRTEKAARRKVERERRRANRLAGSEVEHGRQGGLGSSRGTSVYEEAHGEPSPRIAVGGDFDEDEMEALNSAAKDLLLGGAGAESDEDEKCGHVRCAEEEEEEDREHAEDDPDEREYAELFTHGIHYSHMTFAQLNYISRDYCPLTDRLYTPSAVIERAYFASERFKAEIPMAPTSRLFNHAIYSSVGRSPGLESHGDDSVDLGLAVPIDPSLRQSKCSEDEQQLFYLIPVDDTTRINERPSVVEGAEGSLGAEASSPRRSSTVSRGAEAFFGLAMETRLGTRGPKPAVFGTEEEAAMGRQFVAHEPCRVGVEIWGVSGLKDKQRLYSSTFFYAGSFFNLYLQRIQKKGALQLGVYLHRQNSSEPFPHPSQPPVALGSSPSILSDVFKSRAAPSVVGSLAPYVDRRKQIRAYFSIWTPNQSGNSLTRFASGPDSFALSQSWGWKSTSLSSEFLGSVPSDMVDSAGVGRFSSLRVTIVMGLA